MDHLSESLITLFFVVIALLIGAFTKYVLKNSKIPYTVALLIIGLVLGIISSKLFGGSLNEHILPITLHQVSKIDPHLIIYIFLPILIFESAFSLEVHLFRRIFTQIATLAVPGLIICTILTAFLVKYVFPWDWPWAVCFMFGALISATDPVAVVALLKEVSSRKRLETLIEGESLLNDGTAIVLFTIFYAMVVNHSAVFSITSVSFEFVVVVLGGILVGILVGLISIFWLGKIFNDPLVEITITIVSAYLTFFIAESLHVSGVMAIVTIALLNASIGRTKISPEVTESLHHFWEVMAFMANTLIFLLVGVIIAERTVLDSKEYWINLAILFIGVIVIRAATIFILMPLLNRISIGFNFKKAVVLVWGGLRGAVALALALAVAQDSNIPKDLAEQVLFLCAGIVALTIFVNGSSMLWILKLVGFDQLPPAKEVTVQKAKGQISKEIIEFIPALETNAFLQEVDWQQVKKISGIDENAEAQQQQYENNSKEEITEKDLSIACKRRLLETERKNYWLQFQEGMLGSTATKKLVDAVERALDGTPAICPRDSLYKYWQAPIYLNWMIKIPLLSDLAIKLSFRRMAIGYDIARGFTNAQYEILSYLSTLAPTPEINKEIKQEIINNTRSTYKKIESLRQAFPEILRSLETYAASRAVLNKERKVIGELVEAGVLDAPEAKKMIKDVEHRIQNLSKNTETKHEVDSIKLLRQVPWMHDIKEETLEKLAKLLVDRVYSENTHILKRNQSNGALVLIVRGSVEILSIENGEEVVTEMLGPGSVVGTKSILTNTVTSTVLASTPVETLEISSEKLRTILAIDPQLAENLTKAMS